MPSRLEFKFRYIGQGDFGHWYGTNEEELADEMAESFSVIDVVEGKERDTGDMVAEWTSQDPEDDEDEDEEEDA